MSREQVRVRTLRAPRRGHREDEYEDAFAFCTPDAYRTLGSNTLSQSATPESVEVERALPLHAAVADGATESAFSGGWSRALVYGFVERPDLGELIAAARQAWEPPEDRRWYVQAKAAQGTHAAFLGMVLDRGSWSAEAVGDCCIFQLRDGELLLSWPLLKADDFTYRPPLISSREEDALPTILTYDGTWTAGDSFILATDALAAWLLATSPSRILSEEHADRFIRDARSEGMRNDDVTAVIITTG